MSIILTSTSKSYRNFYNKKNIPNYLETTNNFPPNLFKVLFFTTFKVQNISNTNYFIDNGPQKLNALALTTTTSFDSISLSTDMRLQNACQNAGCLDQFYNGASPNILNTSKTVLLIDLCQLYLDNMIFSNVVNNIFLIYSSEQLSNNLNLILDKIGCRVKKITCWGNTKSGFGALQSKKVNNELICLPVTDTDGVIIYDITKKTCSSLGSFITVAVSHTSPFVNEIVAPNGHLIGFPYNETRIVDIDASSKIITMLGTTSPSTGLFENNYPSTSGQGRFSNMNNIITLSNDNILAFPQTPNYVTEYNCVTKQIETYGHDFVYYPTGNSQLVYMDDSLIVAIPFGDTKIININSITKTSETYGTFPAGYKYLSYQIINDDLITCVPYTATCILNIHPRSKTYETYGIFAGSTLYRESVLLDNGHILGIPYNATQFLDIDPINKTYELWGNFPNTITKYISFFKTSNRKLLAFPLSANYIIEIDPINKSFINKYDLGVGNKFYHFIYPLQIDYNQIINVPYQTLNIVDYDPISNKLFKLGYFSGGSFAERFSRSTLSMDGSKRILITKSYEPGVVDLILR